MALTGFIMWGCSLIASGGSCRGKGKAQERLQDCNGIIADFTRIVELHLSRRGADTPTLARSSCAWR